MHEKMCSGILLTVRQNSAGIPKQDNKEKQKQRTKLELYEDRLYGCQETEQSKMQSLNRKYQNQSSTEI